MRRKRLLLAGTLLAVLAGAAPSAAETFVVDTTQDLTGTTCPQGACSIRRAVVAAEQTPDADVITIPSGTYTLTQGPLVITQPIAVVGAGARTTTIFASSGARVFDIASTSATLSHLTVAGGTADSSNGFHGGNIRAQQSSVVLDHMHVTDGSASSGGGIANRNGSMIVQYSLVDQNAANTGGGDGGGILNFGGDGLGPATLSVHDSTIALNTARLVGGIIQYGDGGDSTSLQGVTMALNQTGDRGGAGNLSVDATGGAHVGNSVLGVSLGGNGAAPNCAGSVTSDGANVADDASCPFTQSNDRSNVDARLFDGLSADGGETDVIPFYPDSPAHDIGGVCTPLDQTDAPRPAGAACDAGAWEQRDAPARVPPPPPPPPSGPTGASGAPSGSVAPGPVPVQDRSVVGTPSAGVVLVKDAKGKFVPFTGGLLPNGTEVDATRGAVTIVTASGERMTFSGGRFRIVQRGGLTTVTLSQPLDCATAKRGKARAAAGAKVKKRRLWGDGKGKFRTQGSYSAATVRGTKWLVEDTCTTTLTRVARGVVSVRDDVLRKTVTLRQGKSYVARAKQR